MARFERVAAAIVALVLASWIGSAPALAQCAT